VYNWAPNVPAATLVRLDPRLQMPESTVQGQGHFSAPHLEVVTEPRFKDDQERLRVATLGLVRYAARGWRGFDTDIPRSLVGMWNSKRQRQLEA
jgi:hypothetical protein